MNKQTFFSFILMIICFLMVGQATGKTVIKLGTLATQESDWGKIFQRMNAELIKESQEQLRFQLLWGQDEGRLVRGIKLGQYHAISLTATALGQILGEFFIFQLPMLFSTDDELDYVREELTPEFSKRLEDKGYVLLGWGELGFIRLFSKIRIQTQSDLQKTRFWVWNIDRIAKAFVSESGRKPVEQSIQSVLSSLQEDEIQTVYAPPLACIAFQWHTQVKYMSDLPLAAGVGATIISKKQYDKLSDEHRALLREITEKYHKQLVKTIREKNKESIGVLKEYGIQEIRVPREEKEKWSKVARQVQDQFEGTLYEKELLDKVRSLLNKHNTKQ